MRRCTTGFLAALCAAPLALPAQQTRAERSGYTETSTHADVVAFVDSLQARGARIHVGIIGRTTEGREEPYIVASRPLVTSPLEAKRLGRPVVYVQGNIHAGEVEGKEALLALVRDLVFDRKPNVLDSIVLIAVPIYNADGNEVFRPQAQNRGAQNGPEMVGQRPNAMGLDLNRDYVKAEAPETRNSLAMFNAWDPDVFVDLHTTDGSYHGYALTYSPSLHPAAAIAGGPFGGAFARDSMLPLIRQRMRARHHFEVFDYGNFSGDEGPAAEGEPRAWATYEHLARYGTNYYGLRGRISILSEAYSHDPFERRVKSTSAFVQEILSVTAQKAKGILAQSRASDAALAAGTVKSVPIRAEMTRHPLRLPVIEEVLDTLPEARGQIAAGRGRGGRGGGGRGAAGRAGGDPTQGRAARGGGRGCQWPLSEPGVRCGFRRTGKFVTATMPVKDRFDATLSVAPPAAYVVRASAMPDSALQRLRLHGVIVEEARVPGDLAGAESFVVDSIVRRAQPFQGHSEVRLEGAWRPDVSSFAGADVYVVRTTQPLGVLAVELLEPQSDDGLVTWNYFDGALTDAAIGKPFPVVRVTRPITFPTRIIR
ncbi:MAG TPA: M14 family metallopeptidase [Gemmatimonadaceae bacterium]|nr:M14 family metallopeptidase [Gemmatimonadaceae bacterium]